MPASPELVWNRRAEAGNNGWVPSFPRNQATRLLLTLVAAAVALVLLGVVAAEGTLGATQKTAPPRKATSPPSRAVAAPAPKVEHAVPFRVGERFDYAISWSSFITATAATATFSVREKKDAYGSLAYYIVAEGRPAPVLAMFYPLYYKADTWLDAYALLPLRASLFSQEGRKRENKVTRFDQAHRTARFEIEETTDGVSSGVHGATLTMPPQTQDPLSALFALRTLPLGAGTRTQMALTFNGNLYQVQVRVDRRESLKTATGTRMAWHITPVLLDEGKPVASPRSMAVWISDDAKRAPLKMEVEITTGRFDFVLMK